MPGVNSVSSIRPMIQPVAPGQAKTSAPSEKANFGDMLKSFVDKVDQDQTNSSTAIKDLIAGKSENILPVVAQAAKADMSFKLLMGVRNKVIEAYKQTMNMQV